MAKTFSQKKPPIPVPSRQQLLFDATVTFHTPKGDVHFKWSAANGDVTYNDELVHNTNDMGMLHTNAKAIFATMAKVQK